MTDIVLPKKKRPDLPYRKCKVGLDLPAWFLEGLRAIDPKLYPVWHEYDLLWDFVINEGLGSAEEPRFHIHEKYGCLNFGFVLTLGDGSPKPDRHWHIWRLSHEGWSHVIKIQGRADPDYLKLLLDRLYFHASYDDKYGRKFLNKKLFEYQELEQQRRINERLEKQKYLDQENRRAWREAMENFASGKIKPQFEEKDIIYSYSGQSNRSRIVRPKTDKEIGLYVDKDYE